MITYWTKNYTNKTKQQQKNTETLNDDVHCRGPQKE